MRQSSHSEAFTQVGRPADNSRRRKRIITYVGLAVAGVPLLVGLIGLAVGVRVNTTGSMPKGIWWARAVHGPLRVGEVVAFCPSRRPAFEMALAREYIEPGDCPSGMEQLLKPVAATAGAVVGVTAKGVLINGRLVPHSAPLKRDNEGRALPWQPRRLVVPKGDVWLISTWNPRSFDSRYFGPVPVASVTATATPLWIEDRKAWLSESH